ncbi:MAG: glycosyltransferase family 39 protein [Patescibacteria group bacterium]
MTKTLSWIQWGLVALMVLSCFGLMLNASLKESATMDELAHIPSGYGYARYLDYRLNPEHPPLVKALSALPLLFQNLNFPTDKSSWRTDVNGQWVAGAQFLYESGNDADKIVGWARLGPMLLTLLLVIFIYIWARELIGRWWALLPTFLFSFSPAVLAHGHYVTTDIGAALGIFLAIYYFVKFLFSPSRKHLIWAGLAFGIAQLIKFSAVLLIPFFIFLIIIFLIWKINLEWRKILLHFLKCAGQLISIFIIGYALVYAVYFLFTFNYPVEKQVSDTKTILTSFADGPAPSNKICDLNHNKLRCLADINIIMSENRLTRPLAEYMLGVLMVMQRSSGGNTAYFLGEVSASGWWYYFPMVFILKEPIPSMILIGLAFLLGLWSIIKNLKPKTYKLKTFSDYIGTHFAEFSMISFVIFYWLYSIKSPLNIGIRHILPTMPFIYILTASALKKWTIRKMINDERLWKRIAKTIFNLIKTSFKGVVIAVLIIWYLTEVLFATPHYLSYFNQFGGGVESGYKYVVDSNYDWGQDLKRLKIFVEKNLSNNDKIAIDYFGGGNSKYYLGENKVEYWQSSKGNPKEEGINWIAISINNLQGAIGKLHQGQLRNPEDEYRWLKALKDPYKPDAKAGTSIFIYHL